MARSISSTTTAVDLDLTDLDLTDGAVGDEARARAGAGATGQAPKVSIGLPVHNGENYLAEALESILAQTYRDFELIICDNASTDGTEAICRRYQERDPRIRYHRQPRNLGACANYDMTFLLSRGTYFKWAAHDDVLAPTFLQRCVDVLDDDPGCDLVHPRTIVIDGDGREVVGYIDTIALDSEDPVERLARWMLSDPHGLCNPVFGLVRQEAMARTALHGDYLSSDRVFLAAMALGGRCREVDEGLFYCRLHDTNSVRANLDKRDLKAWFSGSRPAWPVFKLWRLLAEFTRTVHRSSLSAREQLRAYRVVLAWASVVRRGLIKELLVIYYLNGRHTALGRATRRISWRLTGHRKMDVAGVWDAAAENTLDGDTRGAPGRPHDDRPRPSSAMKRFLDIAVAAPGLVLVSPILAAAAIAIVVSSGRPVLLRQERIGQDFRRFEILKLRTMRLQPGPEITAADDPRITRVGRWLRRTRIDELPQLWNVLRGDMSLVGPRPSVPVFVDRFRSEYAPILTVRPGITDEASLRYRNEEDLLAAAEDPEKAYAEVILPDKLRLAQAYVADRSLRGDIGILLRTVTGRP